MNTRRRLENVEAIVGQVKAPGYSFDVGHDLAADGRLYIWVRVTYDEKDVFSGTLERQHGRRWLIEDDASDAAILQTCFKAYLTSLEHRAREMFTYQNMAVLHPHHSLEDLMQTAQIRNHSNDDEFFLT